MQKVVKKENCHLLQVIRIQHILKTSLPLRMRTIQSFPNTI